jgi:hypothetical protein
MLAIRTIGSWITQTFAPPSERRRRAVRFRPTLEVLGDRVVPAVYEWTGEVSTDPRDLDNWILPGEEMPGFPPPAPSEAPGSDDELHFGPLGSVSTNCDLYELGVNSFVGISIASTYEGVVSIDEALSLEYLTVAGGTLDQLSSSADITVTDILRVDRRDDQLNRESRDAHARRGDGPARTNEWRHSMAWESPHPAERRDHDCPRRYDRALERCSEVRNQR